MEQRIASLRTGADARLRNPGSRVAAVLVNGGTAKAVAGTWSATSELLADELAPAHPSVTFVEVRYRVKTWNAIPSCIEDARAALELARDEGAERVLMIGFSMGGAVSIGVADDDTVEAVLGLAPWIPDRLPVDGLAGKRLDILHGSWDRFLPGVPGVSPASSRRGFERALQAGAHGTYTMLGGALHGAALRRGSGALFRLPRWRSWVRETGNALLRFA